MCLVILNYSQFGRYGKFDFGVDNWLSLFL
jgi:hypothetical protein